MEHFFWDIVLQTIRQMARFDVRLIEKDSIFILILIRTNYSVIADEIVL